MTENSSRQDNAFVNFAHVAQRVAATSKRIEKAAILGEYFTKLSDEDLVLATRYFAGYIFPLHDQRIINIGGATLSYSTFNVYKMAIG
ncbi:MAG: hypothetical protein KME55_06260 [Nostoc indistinguendum CM1-VF10]|nr:hypothetical protein [Nostoc indistinguendum CM1-VF10]